MSPQTEFEFTLPRGYVDREGQTHRTGRMRLATALDEIAPLRDPRVHSNQAYLAIILMSRVITQLGTLSAITPEVVENLFAADMAYLQAFYHRINEAGQTSIPVACPQCQAKFELDLASLGGS